MKLLPTYRPVASYNLMRAVFTSALIHKHGLSHLVVTKDRSRKNNNEEQRWN